MSKLLVVNDGKRERELLLVESLVVGRDPACDISHDDVLLSRRHAEFLSSRDEVTVRDLGSRNGIFVNGTRTAERSLRPGDVVQIGPLRVRYVAAQAPVSAVVEDLDATKVITGLAATAAAAASPTPPSPVAAAPVDEFDREPDDVTRAFEAPVELLRDASKVTPGFPASDMTLMTPAPTIPNSRVIPAAVAKPTPLSPSSAVTAVRTPIPAAPPPRTQVVALPTPPPAPAPIHTPVPPAAVTSAPVLPAAPPAVREDGEPSLTAFVFVQLAALSSVIFVISAGPLIMWRGEPLASGTNGGAVALLRWPVLPIVIAVAATYVVAALVNRRFLEALTAARQGSPRAVEGDPDRSTTGAPRA